MTARLILPADADRDEWLAERRKGVTASEIAALIGISPFDSPFNLYWKKTGQIPEDYDNDRMSLGRWLEPWVASRFQAAHPDLHLVSPAGLWGSVERPWQLATPDGLLYDGPSYGVAERDGVFEVEPLAVWEGKTSATYEEWGEDGSADIPAYIAAQTLWQMDVMGVSTAYVSCLFLANQKVRTYEIGYDVVDVDLMRRRATAFLVQLADGTPPPLDAHTATTTALKALSLDVDEDEEAALSGELAARYREACALVKRAEEHKQQAENELRAAMGDAKYAVDPDGRKVATRSVYDRKGYTVGPARIDALKPTRTKKEATA